MWQRWIGLSIFSCVLRLRGFQRSSGLVFIYFVDDGLNSHL